MPIKTAEGIQIGGLRLSDELVELSMTEDVERAGGLMTVLQSLAQSQINLPFFCSVAGPPPGAGFCVVPEALAQCWAFVDEQVSGADQLITICRSAGTLTVFPHRGRAAVLGGVLEVFAENRFPIYALCTSLSGLTVATDYAVLDAASRAMQTVFELPLDHTPFRPEPLEPEFGAGPATVRVAVETAASYWEQRIRMYGINRDTALNMIAVELDPSELHLWGRYLQAAGGGHGQLVMAVMQRLSGGCSRLVIIDRGGLECPADGQWGGRVIRRPVELLYLHGPHFQDRYGVVVAALTALADRGLSPVAVACAGSSIYLAIPEDTSSRGAEALTERFIVPIV